MEEYWITHVRMKGKRIEHVKAFMVTIEGFSNPVRYSREEIVKSINEDDKWYIPAAPRETGC